MATENKKYIPALRFPELQNDGEWAFVLVKNICSISTGKSNTQDQVKDGKYPFFIRSQTPVYSNRYLYDCEAVITIGDGKIGQVFHYINGKFDLHQRCYFMSKFTGVFGKYFYYYFSANFYKRAMRMTAKATVDSVRMEMISDMPFLMPSFNEQKKIADCLSSLDKYIEATKRKLEQLKEHKKGLMQRLFPAKGKTTPELRFPEFQDDGEWNYEHGDMLYDSIVNKKHKSDLPILAITQENGAIPRDEINYRVVVEDKSIEGYKVVEVGDFIISLRSFQGGIEYSRCKGLCSPAYIVLRKRHSKICDDFYRHYFKSFQYIQELNRNLEGIRDGKMVSYKQFADIKLPYPNYEEQCKIAKVLSSIDDVIQTHIDKVLALELHKKGLMQQLFPKL